MIFRKLIKKNSKSFKNEVGENYSYNMCLAETDFSQGNICIFNKKFVLKDTMQQEESQ